MKHYKHKITGKLIGLENTIPQEDYLLLTPEEFDIIKNKQLTIRELSTEEVIDEVTNSRKKAYTLRTDPLLNEARIKRLLGEEDQADALEISALEERLKIQEEFPFPVEEV